MQLHYNPNYPSVDDLRKRAAARIPKFAFEYLDGGCNEDVNLLRNTTDIREVELRPQYLTHTMVRACGPNFSAMFTTPRLG